MAEENQTVHWRVIGHSVRGATHERVGLPNQDAINWLPKSGAGVPLILAVADGHGSERSFRSEIGARLAVETATQVISDFLLGQTQAENLSAAKRAAEEWLPVAIVRRWLEAVENHLASQPLSTDELALPGAKHIATSEHGHHQNSPLAYGTTILAAAVAADFILFLQLGDGEILTVSDDGKVTSPLPKDKRLFANETTSLCSQEAWRDFRVSFQVLSNSPPALILLSTDGYPNSFRDESGFHKVGSDILELIRTGGLDMVNNQLESWLTESTYAGSGDDVTLGLICFENALEQRHAHRPGSARAKKSGSLGGEINDHLESDTPKDCEI